MQCRNTKHPKSERWVEGWTKVEGNKGTTKTTSIEHRMNKFAHRIFVFLLSIKYICSSIHLLFMLSYYNFMSFRLHWKQGNEELINDCNRYFSLLISGDGIHLNDNFVSYSSSHFMEPLMVVFDRVSALRGAFGFLSTWANSAAFTS